MSPWGDILNLASSRSMVAAMRLQAAVGENVLDGDAPLHERPCHQQRAVAIQGAFSAHIRAT